MCIFIVSGFLLCFVLYVFFTNFVIKLCVVFDESDYIGFEAMEYFIAVLIDSALQN